MPMKKPMQRKALLAIAFAGGLLTSQLPAFCEDAIKSTDSPIQILAKSKNLSPECRTEQLLHLARAYLSGEKKSEIESHYATAGNWQDHRTWRSEKNMASWADMVSAEPYRIRHGIGKRPVNQPISHQIDSENLVLANEAIENALAQLPNSKNEFAKLNMYFIASLFYQQTGNVKGAQNCNKNFGRGFSFL